MLSSRSYTRITLSLDIIRKLDSGQFKGYHELGIIKHQIDLCDTISIEESNGMIIQCDNPLVPRDKTNICWQTADLIKKQYNIRDTIKIVIEKNIPVMGGLAGGSANAATTLLMLNQLWKLNLTKAEMMKYGRELGMDVPYFFAGLTAFDSESTCIITPIPNNLSYTFMLVIPNFGVPTKEAYQSIDYQKIGRNQSQTNSMIDAFRAHDRKKVMASLHNDFELSVFQKYPALSNLKNEMEKAGCAAVCLSGSGSTRVGIVDNPDDAPAIAVNLQKVPGVADVKIAHTLPMSEIH
jgi:4-diphosphocytidyl-2-C-methyl-D-erythritol kinase